MLSLLVFCSSSRWGRVVFSSAADSAEAVSGVVLFTGAWIVFLDEPAVCGVRVSVCFVSIGAWESAEGISVGVVFAFGTAPSAGRAVFAAGLVLSCFLRSSARSVFWDRTGMLSDLDCFAAGDGVTVFLGNGSTCVCCNGAGEDSFSVC